MKKLLILAALLGIAAGTLSCEEKLGQESVITEPMVAPTPFDNWLYSQFVAPYNIEISYRLIPKTIDITFEVTPATTESAQIMAVLLKHLYVDVYAQASPDGIAFNQRVMPKQILLVGSGAWMADGRSQILGQASGGKTMLLYSLNDLSLDPNDPSKLLLAGSDVDIVDKLLDGYFHTIHHEFGHILHQLTPYGNNWESLSSGLYVGETWLNYSLEQALNRGFISNYGMSMPNEDFVELFSYYICYPEKKWNDLMASASEDGRKRLTEKINYLNAYLDNNWNMSLNHLREIVLDKAGQLNQLDYVNLK
jgi:substrate import-associated zinc metallohydrolase lipoprotein